MTSSRKFAKTGLRLVGNVLLFAVLVGSLGFVVPSLMGYDRYVIMGGSMTGTYDIGSVVFEEEVPVDELQVGDVITYMPPADSGIPNLVTHRISKITADPETGEPVFRTKGDNNPKRDPWTFQLTTDVPPRVVAGVPDVGYAFMALADRDKRMMIVGIPAALIALISIVELAAASRSKKGTSADPTEGDESATSPERTDGSPAADEPEIPTQRHRATKPNHLIGA